MGVSPETMLDPRRHYRAASLGLGPAAQQPGVTWLQMGLPRIPRTPGTKEGQRWPPLCRSSLGRDIYFWLIPRNGVQL